MVLCMKRWAPKSTLFLVYYLLSNDLYTLLCGVILVFRAIFNLYLLVSFKIVYPTIPEINEPIITPTFTEFMLIKSP